MFAVAAPIALRQLCRVADMFYCDARHVRWTSCYGPTIGDKLGPKPPLAHREAGRPPTASQRCFTVLHGRALSGLPGNFSPTRLVSTSSECHNRTVDWTRTESYAVRLDSSAIL